MLKKSDSNIRGRPLHNHLGYLLNKTVANGWKQTRCAHCMKSWLCLLRSYGLKRKETPSRLSLLQTINHFPTDVYFSQTVPSTGKKRTKVNAKQGRVKRSCFCIGLISRVEPKGILQVTLVMTRVHSDGTMILYFALSSIASFMFCLSRPVSSIIWSTYVQQGRPLDLQERILIYIRNWIFLRRYDCFKNLHLN